MKGVPDIIVVHNKRFIGFEVKRAKGKQSPAQKLFQKRVEAAGGLYFVVTCLWDVRKAFGSIANLGKTM